MQYRPEFIRGAVYGHSGNLALNDKARKLVLELEELVKQEEVLKESLKDDRREYKNSQGAKTSEIEKKAADLVNDIKNLSV